MEPKTSKIDEKLLTPDQLCDALEVYLGREKGQRKCRELLTKLEDDPTGPGRAPGTEDRSAARAQAATASFGSPGRTNHRLGMARSAA